MFRETQRFHPLVYVAVAAVGLVLPAALLAQAPPPTPGGWVAAGAGMTLAAAFFAFVRLETAVNVDRVRVRLVPFPTRVIPLADVRSADVRTYRPIHEYGGWGLRYGRAGWAYNARGDHGVQLVLADGTRVLVGSQRPEELAEAILAGLPPRARG